MWYTDTISFCFDNVLQGIGLGQEYEREKENIFHTLSCAVCQLISYVWAIVHGLSWATVLGINMQVFLLYILDHFTSWRNSSSPSFRLTFLLLCLRVLHLIAISWL